MSFRPSARWSAAPTLAMLAAVVLGCDRQLSQPGVGVEILPVGTWGGDSAGMIVGDTAVHFHVACTFGDVSGRIAVNGAGEFNAAGSYMLRAFPIAVGPTLPARFVGRIDGNSVTATVIVDDTVQKRTVVRGPVKVTLGVDPRLGPCPICRREDAKGSMRQAPMIESVFSPTWPIARSTWLTETLPTWAGFERAADRRRGG